MLLSFTHPIQHISLLLWKNMMVRLGQVTEILPIYTDALAEKEQVLEALLESLDKDPAQKNV